MIFDKKKAANIIFEKQGKQVELKPEVAMADGGEVDPMQVACEDMIGAIQNKSAMDFHKALSSYIDLRGQASEEDNEPEE